MRLYYGTYGHHLSGKLYVYLGGDNFRTGQQVVAPVTNKWSGKTYNTMFTIARTQSMKNGEGEIERLSSQGIALKSLGGTDVLTLPGGQEFGTKKAWKAESEERYRKKYNLDRAVNIPDIPQSPDYPAEKPQKTNAIKTQRSIVADKKRANINKISLKSSTIKDTATEKAKAALLAKKTTPSNALGAKERLKQIKGREAFIK